MFSIHGVTGQTFRGSLEHLIQVPGAFAARHARGIHREGDELGAEFELVRRRVSDEQDHDPRYARAAAAYAKSLHPETHRESVRHAYQVMGRSVLTLRVEDTVEAAWHRLMARGVRQAPVLDPARGVVGMVSERELLTVLDLVGKTPTGGLERQVREVMASPVICADPVTDIRRIARVLLETGLTALPVVDEAGRLAGIVSRGDILRAVLSDPPLSLWI
ncbi:MAG: putative membrane protein [bacterium]|nr:MAG: putative membrane protein [bacterium]KAF0147663.1 MAG: putative membrane protein [bacterium]KAF0166750.1 MAG: putative membrane protein [bacterium]TXT19155.1 MAG: membrane protein [bacterium]